MRECHTFIQNENKQTNDYGDEPKGVDDTQLSNRVGEEEVIETKVKIVIL